MNTPVIHSPELTNPGSPRTPPTPLFIPRAENGGSETPAGTPPENLATASPARPPTTPSAGQPASPGGPAGRLETATAQLGSAEGGRRRKTRASARVPLVSKIKLPELLIACRLCKAPPGFNCVRGSFNPHGHISPRRRFHVPRRVDARKAAEQREQGSARAQTAANRMLARSARTILPRLSPELQTQLVKALDLEMHRQTGVPAIVAVPGVIQPARPGGAGAVPCPGCGAIAGEACRSYWVAGRYWHKFHAPREKAWELAMAERGRSPTTAAETAAAAAPALAGQGAMS
jgi:hypothetical protein